MPASYDCATSRRAARSLASERTPKSTSARDKLTELQRQGPDVQVAAVAVAVLLLTLLSRTQTACMVMYTYTYLKKDLCVVRFPLGVHTLTCTPPPPRDVPEELTVQAALFPATAIRVRYGALSLASLVCALATSLSWVCPRGHRKKEKT